MTITIADDLSCVYLKRLFPQDVNHNYVSWLNNSDINKYLECRHTVHTFESVTNYVESLSLPDSDEYLFGIFLVSTSEHIGNIKVGPINTIHGHAPIGLMIGNKDYWGKGIATQAIKLISDNANRIFDLSVLYAGCYSDNIGSYRAFIKAGWSPCGIMPSFWSNSNFSNIRNDELLITYSLSSSIALPSSMGFTLIGCSQLLLDTAVYLRKLDIAVLVIFAPRHFSDLAFNLLSSIECNVIVSDGYPDQMKEIIDILPKYNAMCLCFGPAWIFSDYFISFFHGRIFNYNGIPLPRYLGGAHFTWQILNSSSDGGCYIQQITANVDRGPIVRSFEYDIQSHLDLLPSDYEEQNNIHGADFLCQFIDDCLERKFVEFSNEYIDWDQSLYFPRLYTPKHAWIDWSWSAEEIVRFCKAFDNPYPGARTYLNSSTVSLFGVTILRPFSTHPFCFGLVTAKNSLQGTVDVIVRDSLLRVSLIKDSDTGIRVYPALGSRLFTPMSKLELALLPVKYDQDGLKH